MWFKMIHFMNVDLLFNVLERNPSGLHRLGVFLGLPLPSNPEELTESDVYEIWHKLSEQDKENKRSLTNKSRCNIMSLIEWFTAERKEEKA